MGEPTITYYTPTNYVPAFSYEENDKAKNAYYEASFSGSAEIPEIKSWDDIIVIPKIKFSFKATGLIPITTSPSGEEFIIKNTADEEVIIDNDTAITPGNMPGGYPLITSSIFQNEPMIPMIFSDASLNYLGTLEFYYIVYAGSKDGDEIGINLIDKGITAINFKYVSPGIYECAIKIEKKVLSDKQEANLAIYNAWFELRWYQNNFVSFTPTETWLHMDTYLKVQSTGLYDETGEATAVGNMTSIEKYDFDSNDNSDSNLQPVTDLMYSTNNTTMPEITAFLELLVNPSNWTNSIPRNVIRFPYPKYEKNKRLLGVNQKISCGLARPNFRFSSNQFNPGRFRSTQTKIGGMNISYPK